MSFIQLSFGYFLPVVYGLWLLVRERYLLVVPLLLTASLVFYGHNQWWVLPVILGYCIVDWLTGVWLGRMRHRRFVLTAGITFNLVVLCFWKYTPLVVETVAALSGMERMRLEAVASGSWVVPMGISFYAFTGIAYMVDVYRREMPAETSFWRYALFTSFFPHLVAGPILRPREFLVHLRPGAMPTRPLAPGEGAFLIGRGFFKKLVLADSIALAIDPFFAHVGDATTAGVWALPYVYLYALQIYFDFSGYTDIARGLGLWFGFRWPENFNWPYLATSVQDFWRRWHMTLSRFLRDYLYIPLGGSTHGPWRTAASLMLTMLLGGLWHGASWSFMLWGAIHGAFLIINRIWGQTTLQGRLAALSGWPAVIWRWLRIALTFQAICLAWCFFRLTDVADSLACLKKWFVFDGGKTLAGGSGEPALWLMLTAYGVATLAARRITGDAALPAAAARLSLQPVTRGILWGGSAGLLALALLLGPGGNTQPFIYFQF